MNYARIMTLKTQITKKVVASRYIYILYRIFQFKMPTKENFLFKFLSNLTYLSSIIDIRICIQVIAKTDTALFALSSLGRFLNNNSKWSPYVFDFPITNRLNKY